MISAVVFAQSSVDALAATLGALVAGVADGLIGDAVIVTASPDPAVAQVADAVGARLLVAEDDPWRRAAAMVRGDWILFLEAGDVPGEGWIRVLERFVALSPPDRRFGRLDDRTRRLLDRFSRRMGRDIRAGDLIHRALLDGGRATVRPVRLPVRLGRESFAG
jgi:hypothetical protein